VHMQLMCCWPDLTDDVTTINIIFTATNKIYVMVQFTDITYTNRNFVAFVRSRISQMKNSMEWRSLLQILSLFHTSGLCGELYPGSLEAVTGVEKLPCRGLLWHMPANRALVYWSQGGRYCIAWHWGSNRSVVNSPLGEPGLTPMYLGLQSMWAPWMVNICFPVVWDNSLIENSEIYEWINEWTIGSGNRASLSIGAPLGDHGEGAPWLGTLRGRWDGFIRSCILGTLGDM